MATSTIVKVRTKLNAKATASTETELSIEWDVTPEKIIELAQRSIVIQYQSMVRISGLIPKTDKIKVSDMLAKKPRAVSNTPAAVAAKASQSPEFLAEVMKLLNTPTKK